MTITQSVNFTVSNGNELKVKLLMYGGCVTNATNTSAHDVFQKILTLRTISIVGTGLVFFPKMI